jgi:hypothetical protein
MSFQAETDLEVDGYGRAWRGWDACVRSLGLWEHVLTCNSWEGPGVKASLILAREVQGLARSSLP